MGLERKAVSYILSHTLHTVKTEPVQFDSTVDTVGEQTKQVCLKPTEYIQQSDKVNMKVGGDLDMHCLLQ